APAGVPASATTESGNRISTSNFVDQALGQVEVCQDATSNLAGVFHISTNAPSTLSATINPAQCSVVATSNTNIDVTVNDTSAGLTAIVGLEIVNNCTVITPCIVTQPIVFLNGGTLPNMGLERGYKLTFINIVRGESHGCTPGFWKNHATAPPWG